MVGTDYGRLERIAFQAESYVLVMDGGHINIGAVIRALYTDHRRLKDLTGKLERERDEAREAVDAIAATDPSLILATEARMAQEATVARIAAQEAQIKGLEASAGKLRAEYGQTIEQRNDQIRIKLEWAERAFAAETALAAERAKTAKLVEAGKALQTDMLERARIGRDAIHGEEYRIVNAGRTAWADFCAAITEAQQ